ncbi:hypothetical protein LptCag_1341 [Leptospirillum ferriphilum]|uniref:Uncharacterized protein n=1 Tax=Leptospirillum ferriphilum TaxID=178606 RepID=A0A094X328_9BACT|nr:hypothetical protein LptCag_1341 [Leptospirillum ferriphilum]
MESALNGVLFVKNGRRDMIIGTPHVWDRESLPILKLM